MLKGEVLVSRVLPAAIFFSLWLDGWFFPLIALPFLYVILVEKKNVQWLGFRRQESKPSVYMGLLESFILAVIYYAIFLHYFSLMENQPPSMYDFFTDAVWYPLYEEVAYRGFFLVHFADFDSPNLSKRNLSANLLQSALFLSIHRHHVASGMPLVLVPVFLLAVLNGLLFLWTRNILGCILSHSAINSFALLLRLTSRTL